MSNLRAMVVDDSTIFRKIVRDILSEIEGVEVVAVASDGETAVRKIKNLTPDLVTLDVEMPKRDGLQVLQDLGNDCDASIIMVSAMTQQGAATTSQALCLGAIDVILKPNSASLEECQKQLRTDLIAKVNAVKESRGGAVQQRTKLPPKRASVTAAPSSAVRTKPVALGIGISTGGPAALSRMLPQLPADLGIPLLIVQHMPPKFTASLASDLNRICKFQVCEAQQDQEIEPNVAYIAPGGRHMKVARVSGKVVAQIADDAPERNCRPSVDVLFRSISQVYRDQAAGLIMTGMGDDGLLGCKLMKRNGSTIVAQDKDSCVVYGMPRQIIDGGLADEIAPLEDLADVILHKLLRRAPTHGKVPNL